MPGILEVKNELYEAVELTYSIQDQEKIDSLNSGIIQPKEKAVISFGFGIRWNEEVIQNYPKNILDTLSIRIGDSEYFCASEKCKSRLINKSNEKSRRKMTISIYLNLINSSFTKN